MDLIRSIAVAASGLRSQSGRMRVISENIANAHTAKTADGTPYRRKMAVASAENKAQFDSEFSAASFDVSGEFDTSKSGTAAYGGGGVSVASVTDNSDFILRYLEAEGLRCVAQDLRGNLPRRIHYTPATGKVIRRLLGSGESPAVAREEKEYVSRISKRQTGGEITLFD